jgi:hypothetical protein
MPAASTRSGGQGHGPTLPPAYRALTGGSPAPPRPGAEDARVELDEVERFLTGRDLWNRLT